MKKEKTAEKPKRNGSNSGRSGTKMPKTAAKAAAAAKTTMTENSSNVSDMRQAPARRAVKKTPIRIIPLGGLSEIGKNMTPVSYTHLDVYKRQVGAGLL